jgi:hypothetical protein
MSDAGFYPRAYPGAIGAFRVGFSQIGTPPFDWRDTVISQYANSPSITGVLDAFAQSVGQAESFDDFFDLMWNIDTAQGYGLDVWGRILGISRTLTVSNVNYFGFEEEGVTAQPFNQAPFYSGQALTSNFSLTDSAYRLLLLAKAAANICDGSIPAINQILLNLFPGRGDCYVTDGQNMTMTYTFKFALSPAEISIVQQSGVLPTPTGVSATIIISP